MIDANALIEEARDITNEDVRQGYFLHRLEGLSPAEARQAVSPLDDPLHPHNRQRGPLVDKRRPIVTDYFSNGYDALQSFTQDHRTEADIEAEDRLAADVGDLLASLSIEERVTLRLLYGFEGDPMTHRQAAEFLGWPLSKINKRRHSAATRLRNAAA